MMSISVRSALPWLLLVAVLVLVLGPVAMIALGAVNTGGPLDPVVLGMGHWLDAFEYPGLAAALWNTAAIVLTRSLLGFLLAIPVAWIVARSNVPLSGALEFGFWISYFLPSLAAVQGWIFLAERDRGLLSIWLRDVPVVGGMLEVYSFNGIIWVHLMSHTVSALAVLLVLAFRNMDSSLEESARLAGASRFTTLRRIVLPLSRPILAMLVLLATVKGLQSYEVEAVLGRPAGIDVYSTLLVKMIADEPPRLAIASVLSTIVLIVLMPMIVVQRLYTGRNQYPTVSGKMSRAPVDLGPVGRWVAFAVVASIVMLQTVVPVVSLIAGSLMVRWGFFGIENPWTLAHWVTVLSNDQFLSALNTTVLLGLASGLAATVICLTVAYTLVRVEFRGKAVMDFVTWLPWAVPGVLLSLGIVGAILAVPPLRALYGSFTILVVAVVLFSFPLCVHLLKSGIIQMNRELEEAARICGASPLRVNLRIVGPTLAPMCIAVAVTTFMIAVNEVSGVVLLASSDIRTLSLLSLDYVAGAFPQREAAAVVTTIMLMLCVGLALFARLVLGTKFDQPGAAQGRPT